MQSYIRFFYQFFAICENFSRVFYWCVTCEFSRQIGASTIFLASFFALQICLFLKINQKTFNGCVSDPLSQKCRSRGHFIGKPSNLLASLERKKNPQNIGKKVHSKSRQWCFSAFYFSVPILLKMKISGIDRWIDCTVELIDAKGIYVAQLIWMKLSRPFWISKRKKMFCFILMKIR